jgi:hypothetical protein
MAARIDVLGVYSLDVDDRMLDDAYDLKFGGLQLSDADAEEARRTVRDEISGVVLVELLVHDRDGRFDVADFHQVGSDQVAYDEAFLTADGGCAVARIRCATGGATADCVLSALLRSGTAAEQAMVCSRFRHWRPCRHDSVSRPVRGGRLTWPPRRLNE